MVDLNVQTALEAVIRERLDTLNIVSVQAEREVAFEDDQILRITIVVDNKAADFDAKKLSSLARYIRAKLGEIRESAFPLVSFMSKAEAEARAH